MSRTSDNKQNNFHLQQWSQRLAQKLGAAGQEILFLKEALYPVLKVDVIFVEQSKEQIGDLEQSLLRMINAGASRDESLAFMTGIPTHRLRLILDDLVNRGVAERGEEDALRLSMLGGRSLGNGKLLTRSSKALLLCGLTGKPLRTNFYDLPRLELSELENKKYLSGNFIPEAPLIELKHVRILADNPLRDINLPDEVVEIEGIDAASAIPMFFECAISVSRTAVGKEICQLHFPCPKGVIDWLTLKQAFGLLPPLGHRNVNSKTKEQALQEIRQAIESLGGKVSKAALNDFGNPVITLVDCNAEFLRARPSGDQIIQLIKCSSQNGSAINRLFDGPRAPQQGSSAPQAELLQGRALTLIAEPRSAIEAKIAMGIELLLFEKRMKNNSQFERGDFDAQTAMSELLKKKQFKLQEAKQLAIELNLSVALGILSDMTEKQAE